MHRNSIPKRPYFNFLNIREYFKNGLQHRCEIFWLLIFLLFGAILSVDCGVHRYKLPWIFEKGLTAQIWDYLTFNIFIIWGHSLKILDPYLYFSILSRLVGEILPRCKNTTFFTLSKNAGKKLIWPR